MADRFKVGDHVCWNSEAGYVQDVIIKAHTRDVTYNGHTHHANEDDPQHEIKATRPITWPCTKGPRSRSSKPATASTEMATTGLNPIFTVGHSTRSFCDVLALLRQNEVTSLVDVRRFLASQKFP